MYRPRLLLDISHQQNISTKGQIWGGAKIFSYNYAGGAQTCRQIVNSLIFNFAKRQLTSFTFQINFLETEVKIGTFCSFWCSKLVFFVLKTFSSKFYGQTLLFYKKFI